jgi:hypothetical protein
MAVDRRVVLRINRGTTGAFRSSRTNRGAQVLPHAGATVPPWLPGKSVRVSNLPACCALNPLACAAPCSCRHGACNGRSAWLPLGRACPSAWDRAEKGCVARISLLRARMQESDHRHYCVLRARRERLRRRAGKQRDELAPPHLPPKSHLLPEMPVEEARDFFECLPGLRRVHVTIVLRVRLPFKDLQHRFDTGLP